MFPQSNTPSQDTNIGVVGGNKFGQYSKISDEETFNMIVTDGWLAPYAGFARRASVSDDFTGRAIYVSERWGKCLFVIGSGVYAANRPAINSTNLPYFYIGDLETSNGDVFIAENMVGEIAIVDGRQIYVFNWKSPTVPALIKATLPVDDQTGKEILPGYISYLNSQLIVTNEESGAWFLSGFNDALDWEPFNGLPWFTFIQSKSTNIIAAVRWPGRGNLLAVFGRTVVEMWTYTGGALFPYQKNQSVNIDYGCINAATIAANENYVMWLSVNEQSGPVIMISSGSDAIPLSTDGIDFKLARLKRPDKSHAFFIKQNGHLFYQITFDDPQDNVTYVYDFTTKLFSTLCDENMDYHPAQSAAFFNNTWYFVSLNDGGIYETSTDLTEYDYGNNDTYEIPRIRVTPTFRLPDNSRFRINALSLLIEQGNDPYFVTNIITDIVSQAGDFITSESNELITSEAVVNPYEPSIDIQMSKDGASTFGNRLSRKLNPIGNRKNMVTFRQLGNANEITYRIYFCSKYRFLAGESTQAITK